MNPGVDEFARVEVAALRKVYGAGVNAVEALRGIDLVIEPGEMIGLMGPSGSGKTTLLNLLGCLDRPTSGSVTIGGKNIFSATAREMARFRAASVGFVFQSCNLFGVLTARENVEYPLLLASVKAAERRRRTEKILDRVGLAGKLERKPDELSGGERQRVAIARSLVHSPRLVLADEPTANLDSATGSNIVDLLAELNRELGVTFVICTHDPAMIGRLGRILAIRDGRLDPPLPT